jgi:hypothetical protein
VTEVAKRETHLTGTERTGRYALPNSSGFKTYIQLGIPLQVANNTLPAVNRLTIKLQPAPEQSEPHSARTTAPISSSGAVRGWREEHHQATPPLRRQCASELH